MLNVPQVLGLDGRFFLRRQLGAGALGRVFLAWDRLTECDLALKLLHRDVARSSDMANLPRWFERLRTLDHPSIVRHRELFHQDLDWFFTMELVEGLPLLQSVRRPGAGESGRAAGGGSLLSREGLTRLLGCLPQLVQALHYLHDQGLVHGDLRGDNVRTTFDDRTYLLDFGLPQLRVSHGEARPLLGALAYLAPEAVSAPPTPRSDWYALGVLLFECLAGVLPFCGDDGEILSQKRTPPRLRQWFSTITQELDDLCYSLMAPRPEARPTAAEILERTKWALSASGLRPEGESR